MAAVEQPWRRSAPKSGRHRCLLWSCRAHPQQFAVHVFQEEGGTKLVAAIELVSPANKDRPDERRAFAAKCVSYLCQDIGLILLDVVTTRRANLHNEIVRLWEREEKFLLPDDPSLYAVAYRPARRREDEQIDIWTAGLQVGRPLPTLPLALSAELCVPVDFEAAYVDACGRRRIALP